MRSFRFLALGVLGLFAARIAHAQVSPFYLTAGQPDGQIFVLQNGVFTNRWTANFHDYDPFDIEYGIAVFGDVRTIGAGPPKPGSQYTLEGQFTGTTYPYPSVVGHTWDATTDGVHNYLGDFTNLGPGTIYSTDREWSNPVALFDVGSYPLGITYDFVNNSLWINRWGTHFIGDYALDGTLLSSFTVPADFVGSLGFDPADQTLWFFDRGTLGSTNTFYQYSRSGAQLSSQSHPELGRQNFLGGEFNGTTVTPEPTTLALMTAGLVAVGAFASRRRKRNSMNT